MSTQTGPAYAIHKHVNIMSIPKMLDDVRAAQKHEILQSFLENLVLSYDNQVQETNFLEHVTTYIRTALDTRENLNDFSPYIDSLTSACVGFYYNEKRDETYARLMGFTNKSVELFEALPIVEREVTYQNSSDSQLANITEEEWHDRQLIWDELDLRARRYPSVLKFPLMNAQMARYAVLSVKSLTEAWDTLEIPSQQKRYKDIFLGEYTKLVVAKTEEDFLTVFMYSSSFNRGRRDDIDYTDLHDHELHPELIKEAHKITETRLAERNIFLPKN